MMRGPLRCSSADVFFLNWIRDDCGPVIKGQSQLLREITSRKRSHKSWPEKQVVRDSELASFF